MSIRRATTAARSIPMLDLQRQRSALGTRLDHVMRSVLDHGQFVLGPEVGRLEEALCAQTGAGFCVTCANGTDALVLALMALGIGEGDAVLVPSFTFVATAEAVALRGAIPVFVDVQSDTFNIDANDAGRVLRWAIDRDMNVRALIAVDLFGRPADYEALRALCDEHRIALIADAAQSFGATSPAGKVGRLADITTTSFFPSKPLGCFGDGGAIFTDDPDLAECLFSLRQHGKGADKYDNVRIGLNSRLDTLQAAVLLAKLEVFERELGQRRRLARFYSDGLSDIEWLTPPSQDVDDSCAWAQYTVRLDPSCDRSALATHLAAQGIATAVYYPTSLHQQSAYRQFPHHPSGVGVAEALSKSVISIPMDPYLEREEATYVVTQCRGFRNGEVSAR